nr:MAG TPA: hypothetical protein [Ackermannviridae sp.]
MKGDVKKETKTRIKQFLCNHYYICNGGDFDEEGKVIRFYLRCRRCGKVKKINGPFREGVL